MLASADPIKADMQARMERALKKTTHSQSTAPTPTETVRSQSETMRMAGLSDETISAYNDRIREQKVHCQKGEQATPSLALTSDEKDSKATNLLRGLGNHAANFLSDPLTSKIAIGLIIGETAFALAGTYDTVFVAKTAVETFRKSAELFSLYGFAPNAAIDIGSRIGIIATVDRLFKWKRVAAEMTEMQRKVTPAMLYLGIAALTTYDAAANARALLGFPHI